MTMSAYRHKFPAPTMNVFTNISSQLSSGHLGDTLVLCLPSINMTSAGHRVFPQPPNLPLKAIEQSIAGDKLPWSIRLSNLSAYTVYGDGTSLYLLKPAALTATLALPVKCTNPISDSIASISVCLHADFDLLHFSLSLRQVCLHSMNSSGLSNIFLLYAKIDKKT
jgi:hypothetical protein